jgi:hypothetical protein
MLPETSRAKAIFSLQCGAPDGKGPMTRHKRVEVHRMSRHWLSVWRRSVYLARDSARLWSSCQGQRLFAKRWQKWKNEWEDFTLWGAMDTMGCHQSEQNSSDWLTGKRRSTLDAKASIQLCVKSEENEALRNSVSSLEVNTTWWLPDGGKVEGTHPGLYPLMPLTSCVSKKSLVFSSASVSSPVREKTNTHLTELVRR